MGDEKMPFIDWDNLHVYELVNGHPREPYEPVRRDVPLAVTGNPGLGLPERNVPGGTMKQQIAAFACSRCGSTEFAVDVVNLGGHKDLDVVCRNCDAYQGELIIR